MKFMAINDVTVQTECRDQLEQMHPQMFNILATFGNQTMAANPKATERMSLLMSTIMKLQESNRGIVALGRLGLPDEMNALFRTQVELVINVCYFQFCGLAEVNRYLHHDAITGGIALKDFANATNGTAQLPSELATRIQRNASEASVASGVDMDDRRWEKETRNLFQRAKRIDTEIGGSDFTQLMATSYVLGSAYVHGSFMILQRHVRFLTQGQRESPIVTMHGVNCILQGQTYLIQMFGRFFSKHYGYNASTLESLAQRAAVVLGVALEDYKAHRTTR